MTTRHVLLTLCRDEISPRFDLTAEVLIAPLDPEAPESERRHLVLAHVSSEELCDLITRAGVTTVICGGIEEDYYHYLRWKRIDVICDVMGPVEAVMRKLFAGGLADGDCLYEEQEA